MLELGAEVLSEDQKLHNMGEEDNFWASLTRMSKPELSIVIITGVWNSGALMVDFMVSGTTISPNRYYEARKKTQTCDTDPEMSISMMIDVIK
ncbi:hypothetical protein NPIL_45971 [Nephila pilipes]|uniref:Uncharacterized protein n=1 Tax=Nephila pilipes TaxID=299642 RepID=A0A8X6NQU8_NEPPI|nr:hypothetical protein NPIL_45971 [Nephila pilipes]